MSLILCKEIDFIECRDSDTLNKSYRKNLFQNGGPRSPDAEK